MAKKKQNTTRTDALGHVHKQFADGRSEIYLHGCDKADRRIEITDATDETVNRRRWIEDKVPPRIEETLTTRDDAVPGIDGLEDDDDDA